MNIFGVMYRAAAPFSPPISVYFPRRDEGRSRRRHLFSRFSSAVVALMHTGRSPSVGQVRRDIGDREGGNIEISSLLLFPFLST